ncbi:ABC transporter permease [Clostridium thailandense]|uniref:ABC transporter permease n=1 Tax=Clostridium thailandense TaxID=2794346 RepID=A0A949TKF1_9CLOT|nr:ABC transporter permease [Clostridium thailandense]MBV7273945.1 ABC transporter permease [Clostridium thailandense]
MSEINKNILKTNNVSLNQLAKEYGIFIALIFLLIVCSIASSSFLTGTNMMNILRQISINGILAVGMTFVMIGGGFDLSVGSILSFAGVIVIGIQSAVSAPVAIIAALLIGILAGLLNGTIMAVINGDSGDAFMITFGMQSFLAALALLYTGGVTLRGSNSPIFNFIGKGFVGPIPMPVLIFIIIALICHFVLTKTRFGRGVFLLGGNYEASRLSGINVKVIKASTYVIAGTAAAIAAMVINARTMGASPIQGVGYEFDAITAVIIGGTSLSGGEGSVLKTCVGVLILGIISNILNLFGFSVYDQYIVKGIIILLAVWFDSKK